MNAIITFLFSSLWIVGLLFLLFHRMRKYRMDALRQELFVIRDELFDYAAQGNIAFHHPAYGALRSLINSLIRFAHKISFSRIIIFLMYGLHKNIPHPLLAVYEMEEGAAKEKLKALHSRVAVVLSLHLICGSPLLWIFLALFLIQLLIRGAMEKTSAVLAAFAKTIRVDILEGLAAEIEPNI